MWVLGRTRIRFRVGKAIPLLQIVSYLNLKLQISLVSTDPPSASRAVLLSTDTEVSIAPKLRNGRNGSETKTMAKNTSQSPSITSPGSLDGPGSSKSSAIGRPIVLRVLPSRLAKFPETTDELQETIAYVSPSTLGCISNHALPLASEHSSYFASIRRLKPPSTIGISGIIDASSSTAPPPVPSAKLIQPKDGKISPLSSTAPELTRGDDRVLFCCLTGIPEQHMLVRGSLPSTDLSDWDLVL